MRNVIEKIKKLMVNGFAPLPIAIGIGRGGRGRGRYFKEVRIN
jgi:hypothetical protein